jgi:hypothetical protein
MDKRGYEWCAFDNHQEPAVKEKGHVKQKVKKEIEKEVLDILIGDNNE